MVIGRQRMGWLLIAALAPLAVLMVPDEARAACDVTESGIPEDAVATIDFADTRKSLAESGIGIGGFYAAETFGNPTGGIKQGATYDGVLELHLDGDMQKLGFWKGLCFHANGYQIHGQSITVENIGSLVTVSNLEATPATRLYELWLEQSMFDKRLSVRVGQLAADGDFFVTEGGTYFLDGTWGWPSLAAADLPSGGPAYPIATPGVRVVVAPSDNLELKVAVYNGDPAGPNCAGNPQVCDNNGLEFNLEVPPLLMAEAVYKYSQGKGQLPGTVKLGGWNHFGSFTDQRIDIGGKLIAVTGLPGRGIYGVIDQLVWRLGASEDPKGIGLFGRAFWAPSDRNLVDFYTEAGVTFTGMTPHRPDDALGIGFAYTGISDRAHGFDLDSGLPVARTF
jgi:porin